GGGSDEPPPDAAGPPIERRLADPLASRSDEIARRLDGAEPCTARAEADAMRNELIQAINAKRLPETYLEDLTAAVNELAEGIPECGEPPPPPPPADDDEPSRNGDAPEQNPALRAEVPRGQTPAESARLLAEWLRVRAG
ncbi:MAG: hypothetical protein M3310_06830, partial [Actinomycetota bacterium]|nr:hypothetical protein [Actinomycetota bacterium]